MLPLRLFSSRWSSPHSPQRGLLPCKSISCRVPSGVCCLSARGIDRSGPTLVFITLILDLDLRIGPGLGLYSWSGSNLSMALITTRGSLAPSRVCVFGRSPSLHDHRFKRGRIGKNWTTCQTSVPKSSGWVMLSACARGASTHGDVSNVHTETF